MNSTTKQSNLWLWLTFPIAILLGTATGIGVFKEGLYQDELNFMVQAMGQDFFTLIFVLPALIMSAILAIRNSTRAKLVWLGLLVYLIYLYVIAAFQVKFNDLFLVYVALLGLSLYAFIGGLVSLNHEKIKADINAPKLVKTISIFLGMIMLFFYFVWLSDVVPALRAGGVPATVIQNELPTNGIHVMDMAWILPAMGLTAVWLWQKRALGFTLAAILLTFIPIEGGAILTMMVYMNRFDQPVDFAPGIIFGFISAIGIGLLIKYLMAIKE